MLFYFIFSNAKFCSVQTKKKEFCSVFFFFSLTRAQLCKFFFLGMSSCKLHMQIPSSFIIPQKIIKVLWIFK